MTVEELREELLKYPPSARVVVDGYEGGYHDVTVVRQKMLELNFYGQTDEDIFGPHGDGSLTLTGIHDLAVYLPRGTYR
jgi:hypothetical protein